jgi:hypothetical protein
MIAILHHGHEHEHECYVARSLYGIERTTSNELEGRGTGSASTESERTAFALIYDADERTACLFRA